MAGNLEVTDLPLIPAVDGADVYAAKNNLDYRVRTGEAGGLATLDGAGKIPSGQLPTGVYLPLTAGVTQPLTGNLYIAGSVWNSIIFNNTGGGVNQKRAGLQVRGDNGDISLFMTQDGEAGAIQWTWTFSRATGTFTSPGPIIGNQSFSTSTTNVVLSNNGSAGGVFLRPNGATNSAGECVIDSAGGLRTTGNLLVRGGVITAGEAGNGNGRVNMNFGNAVAPGYVEFLTADSVRRGYVGFASASNITFTMENGWGLAFQGGAVQFLASSPVTFSANTRVSNGVMQVYHGNVGTQVQQYESGWNNGVTRWRQYLETNADYTFYAYDAAGAFAGRGITFNSAGIVTSTNFVATSDRNLKTDITDRQARRGLADKLRLVDFIWKSNGNKDQGLIAQEVQDIAPEYVHKDSEGTLAIDKVGLLLECVVDLAARVRELEAK